MASLRSVSGNESSVLCISNLHLFVNWLPKLARLCLDHVTTTQNALKGYGGGSKKISLVVLISETEAEMPINLMELCSKFKYQPPTGLQAQLTGLLEQSNRNDAELVQFAYLHVICSERRNYVPIGWLKYYEFGLNEYQTGLFKRNNQLIQSNLKPWKMDGQTGFVKIKLVKPTVPSGFAYEYLLRSSILDDNQVTCSPKLFSVYGTRRSTLMNRHFWAASITWSARKRPSLR